MSSAAASGSERSRPAPGNAAVAAGVSPEDLLLLEMEQALSGIEEKFLAGKMQAFARNPEGLVAQMEELQKRQARLTVDHIALESKHPYAEVDDESFDPQSSQFDQLGQFFQAKDKALGQISRDLHKLSDSLDAFNNSLVDDESHTVASDRHSPSDSGRKYPS